jgi:aminoglycoside phosphotransferase family enzyme
MNKRQTVSSRESKEEPSSNLLKRIFPYIYYTLYVLRLYSTILFFVFYQSPKLSIQSLSKGLFLRRRYPLHLSTGMLPYVIKDIISSLTTQVIFTKSKTTNIPICVKVWQREHWEENIETQIAYFLEGFIYNQHNAPGVYLGITYVDEVNEGAMALQRGSIINFPQKSKMKDGEYAIVMKELSKDWRLDIRLSSDTNSLATSYGMKFLACEIAHLHKRAKHSSKERGTVSIIYEKLTFNRKRFEEALDKLLKDERIDRELVDKYKLMSHALGQAYEELKVTFIERHNKRRIKRCHGDLKLTNLWVRPTSDGKPERLLALDCIDFKPDFCHIDTLSDVAMLIIDLERHLGLDKIEIINEFRSVYLKEMAEQRIDLLLEYYIAEKALVCTYVSILFDNAPNIGEIYLVLVQKHISQLSELLSTSTVRQEVYTSDLLPPLSPTAASDNPIPLSPLH